MLVVAYNMPSAMKASKHIYKDRTSLDVQNSEAVLAAD